MDIRRSVLWMIFSFSLLLLWNNWQVHNGKPSLFGGTPAAQQQAANPDAAAAKAGSGAITPSVPTGTPAAQAGPSSTVPGSDAPIAAVAEQIVIESDVLRLTFDTTGAQIIRAELPMYPVSGDVDHPFVLLDKSNALTYVVQSGVVGAQVKVSPRIRRPSR